METIILRNCRWAVVLLAAPLYRNLPYAAQNDFTPINQFNIGVNLLVMHPSLPVKSVVGLIGYAKANPGRKDCRARFR